VGREASGSTDWKFKSDILTYSRARGIFAGINLNGAVLKQDKDETAVLYGRSVPFKAIVSGNVPVPRPRGPLSMPSVSIRPKLAKRKTPRPSSHRR
jgi:lipid-binding SYLF domain-containing protein